MEHHFSTVTEIVSDKYYLEGDVHWATFAHVKNLGNFIEFYFF